MAAIYSTSIMDNYISKIKRTGGVAGYKAMGAMSGALVGLASTLVTLSPVSWVIGGILGAVICGYYKKKKDEKRDIVFDDYMKTSKVGDKLKLSRTLGLGSLNLPQGYFLPDNAKDYIETNGKWGKIEIEKHADNNYYFAGTEDKEFKFITNYKDYIIEEKPKTKAVETTEKKEAETKKTENKESKIENNAETKKPNSVNNKVEESKTAAVKEGKTESEKNKHAVLLN